MLTVLGERGYRVYKVDNAGLFDMAAELEAHGYLVIGEDSIGEHKLREECEERGLTVLDDNIEWLTGYELYVTRSTGAFRQWLRDLFWQTCGRIA